MEGRRRGDSRRPTATPFTSPSAVDLELSATPMEPQLRLKGEEAVAPGSPAAEEVPRAGSVLNFRTVPWLSWDEWDHLRVSLFSSSPDAIEAALVRISSWRRRGYIPPAIEVTADSVTGQQMNPFFQ